LFSYSTNGVPCIDDSSQRLTVLIPEPMIHSASSSSSAARNGAIATDASASPFRTPRSRPDQVNTDQAAALRASLQQVAEVRPEVVERARALAADPGYPSDDIIRRISAAIVNSPDLSEESS
jgi:hypothetical protein